MKKFGGSWNQTHDLSVSSRLRLPLDHHYSQYKIKWKQEIIWSSLQWNVRPVFISNFWPQSSSFNVSVDCEIIPFRNPNKLIDLRNLIFWSSINQHYRIFDFIAGWSTWNSFSAVAGPKLCRHFIVRWVANTKHSVHNYGLVPYYILLNQLSGAWKSRIFWEEETTFNRYTR